jgi:gas vesicle protein
MSESTTRSQSRLSDDIEAITDFSEHLDVVGRLLQQIIPNERRSVYEQKIAAIVRRASDPNLRLAVVGEFCSGKSTFINGLLRSRLLKAACVANTASVTQIRKGPSLTITASFTDGSTVTATGDDFSELRGAVIARQPTASADDSLKALLDRLTSDPVVADEVRDVNVTLPTEQLDDNIIILDTPGIGAGTEAAKNHARVTQHVVADVADCALVLIPAANPMTATLITFLESYARPFLHRCIFVLTAMDRQDEDERAETHAYTRAKLQETLGLESPLLLESAAITVVPTNIVPDTSKNSSAHWQSAFVVLESSVRSALMRERTLIIAEHLIRLLQELIDEMERELAESAAALLDEERILNENSVAALESVLDELSARSTAEVERRRQMILQQTATHRHVIAGAAKEWVFGLIQRAGWKVKNYSRDVHPEVVAAVQHYGRQYTEIIDREIGVLSTRCELLSAEFAREFERSYKELPSLGVPVSVPPISIAPLPDLSAFRSAVDHAEKQGAVDQKRDTTGLVVGGVFSSMLLGPVGALLLGIAGCTVGCNATDDSFSLGGAFIGWWIGAVAGFLIAVGLGSMIGTGIAGVSGPSLRDRQHKLRALLTADIDAYFDQTQQQFETHIEKAARGVIASFRSAVDRHKSAYGAAVANLRREHEQKQQSVAQKIAAANIDRTDLARRTERLKTVRRRLASSRIPG